MASSTGTRLERGALAVAILLPLALYVRTLAHSVTPLDGGELAAACAVLGIAHPPGYPLFTLLGHLASVFPIGSVYARISALSALATSAASGVLFLAAWRLIEPMVVSRGARMLALAGALAGALLYAIADTVWSQSVVVEVYALHGLLLVVTIALLLAATSPRARVRFELPGFTFGLSLAHHLTAALLAPAMLAAFVLLWRDGRLRSGRALMRAAGAAVLPLFLYLALPIRSLHRPAVNWDYPETWTRLRLHATAAQYQPVLGEGGLRGAELTRFLTRQLPSEATWLLPLLALLGIVALARENRRALLLTAPVLLAFLIYNLAYAIEDIQVYYLPVILALSLWAAIGAAWIGMRVAKLAVPVRALFLLALAVPLAMGAARNLARNDRHDDAVTETFARDVVRYAEHGAVIFSDDPIHFSQPMLFLQTVERLRPDIVVLDLNRLQSPMVERALQQACPDLAQACKSELTATADFASRAERHLPYDGKAWDHAYDVMMWSLAHEATKLRPTYAMVGAVSHPMFEGLTRHPEGLLVRFSTDRERRDFPAPRFDLPRALLGRTLVPEEQELLDRYVYALSARLTYEMGNAPSARLDSVRTTRDAIQRQNP